MSSYSTEVENLAQEIMDLFNSPAVKYSIMGRIELLVKNNNSFKNFISKELTRIGNALGLEGEIKDNFGIQHIVEQIKELQSELNQQVDVNNKLGGQLEEYAAKLRNLEVKIEKLEGR